MHYFLPSVLCTDSALGRVDISMLDDQARMELFMTPDEYEEARRAYRGDEDNACSWAGVDCDCDKNVTSISWHICDLILTGEINFQVVPQKLYRLNMYQQQLRGTVDFGPLPETLRIFCAQDCQLSGTLDFEKLPEKIEQVFCSGNRITGVINLDKRPVEIQSMHVGEAHVENECIHIGKSLSGGRLINFKGMRRGIRYVFDDPSDEKRCVFSK